MEAVGYDANVRDAAEQRWAIVRFGPQVAFTLNGRTLAIYEHGLEEEGEEQFADIVGATFEAVTGEELGPPLDVDVGEILAAEEHEGWVMALLDVLERDPEWLYATLVENFVADGDQGVLKVAAYCAVHRMREDERGEPLPLCPHCVAEAGSGDGA